MKTDFVAVKSHDLKTTSVYTLRVLTNAGAEAVGCALGASITCTGETIAALRENGLLVSVPEEKQADDDTVTALLGVAEYLYEIASNWDRWSDSSRWASIDNALDWLTEAQIPVLQRRHAKRADPAHSVTSTLLWSEEWRRRYWPTDDS